MQIVLFSLKTSILVAMLTSSSTSMMLPSGKGFSGIHRILLPSKATAARPVQYSPIMMLSISITTGSGSMSCTAAIPLELPPLRVELPWPRATSRGTSAPTACRDRVLPADSCDLLLGALLVAPGFRHDTVASARCCVSWKALPSSSSEPEPRLMLLVCPPEDFLRFAGRGSIVLVSAGRAFVLAALPDCFR